MSEPIITCLEVPDYNAWQVGKQGVLRIVEKTRNGDMAPIPMWEIYTDSSKVIQIYTTNVVLYWNDGTSTE